VDLVDTFDRSMAAPDPGAAIGVPRL